MSTAATLPRLSQPGQSATAPPSTRQTAPRPTLLHPVEGAPVEGGGASFAWTALPGTRHYRLQIAADDTFRPLTLVLDAGIQDATDLTVYGVLPEDGSRWFWRVRGEADAWSLPARFVAAGPDAVIAHHEARRAAAVQQRKETLRRRQPGIQEGAEALPPYLVGTTSDRGALLLTAVAVVGLLVCILAVVMGGGL